MQILILGALYSIFWIFYKLNPEKGLATIILKLQCSIKPLQLNFKKFRFKPDPNLEQDQSIHRKGRKSDLHPYLNIKEHTGSFSKC